MAFAAGYDYDLFISYAAVDDIEIFGGNNEGWISFFVTYLESILASRLGGREKPRIYFDRRNLSGNHQLQELLDCASRSALFLAIASPAYVEREWTRKELATFTNAAGATRRLFAMEYLPLDEGERYPGTLESHKRMKFWDRDETFSFAAMPMKLSSDAFRSRIHDLADQIKRQLVAMNAAELARLAISQAADTIADEMNKRGRGVAFVAQTTDDLEEERLQLERYLGQYRFMILPETGLPGGGEAFRVAAEADIRKADLYVHLLGPKAGRYPADLPDGYGMTQFQAAKAAKVPCLLWRRPDLDVDTILDGRQKSLLTDQDVMACGLQEFMKEARRRLDAQAGKKEEKPTSPSLVFINAAKNDHLVAKIAQQEFSARNMSVAIPLYDGPSEEVQKDLSDNMRECDVMVFIYGDAPPTWVRGQLRLFSKIRPATPAKMVAIFVGPPEEQHGDLGFTVPGLRRVDFPQGWAPERMREVIEEIST